MNINIKNIINSYNFEIEWQNEAIISNNNCIVSLLKCLQNNKELCFSVLVDLFGVDFLNKKNCFEIVYHLLSLKLNKRLIIKLFSTTEEVVPSIVRVFSSAGWYEREIYDMFGIKFENKLLRILTDDDFQGYPLRKDFPVTGYYEMHYNTELEKLEYTDINLDRSLCKLRK